MIFGDFDFGPNVVTTPLVQKISKTYYHVTFEGFSVGDKRISISDDLSSTKPLLKGNMIVDSGMTLTMLPPKLYDEFETAIKEAINVRTIKDPQKVLNLCYRLVKVTKTPEVTMHFDGADVELNRDNVFVTVSKPPSPP
ncbi:putative nepenthesin [Helianthus annuus]|nr:putative nepenthesin [Helianthus annuus]